MSDTLRLPTYRSASPVASSEVAYEILQFPLPLEAIPRGPRGRTEAEGLIYLEWVKSIESARTEYALDTLRSAGAPLRQGMAASGQEIGELEKWLSHWWPIVMAPWKGTCWNNDDIGMIVFAKSSMNSFCERMYRLEESIGHDLGFVVLQRARALGRDLKWHLSTRENQSISQERVAPYYFLPTVRDDRPFLFDSMRHALRVSLASGAWARTRKRASRDMGILSYYEALIA